MSKTLEPHTYVLSSLLRTKKLIRELSWMPTLFRYTLNSHPQGMIAESGGLPDQISKKAHHFEYLALPSAREWLNNTYIVHWVCHMPVMRERKTLWGSYTPRHYLLRSFVSWWFKDTRWETVLESMITRENGQNTYGKAWALHGSCLKPLWFGDNKIPFSRRKLFYRGQCLWPYSL